MKIKIKDKKSYTGYQLDEMKAFADGIESLDWEKEMAAAVYGINNWDKDVLRWDAAQAMHGNSGDVWIEAIIRGDDGFVDVGFYLSDLWQSTGDNREELQSKAYRRVYRLEQ
jgi:hypothetical protein